MPKVDLNVRVESDVDPEAGRQGALKNNLTAIEQKGQQGSWVNKNKKNEQTLSYDLTPDNRQTRNKK